MTGSFLLRLFAWSLALALLALPVVGLLNGSFASERWPLRRLDLQAERLRVDPAQVQMIVARHAGAGFFALSLSELHAELAALPWVESVHVRKRWPDTVSVRLLEYQPYAVWSGHALVSRSGRLFQVPGIELIDDLPRLSGPDHDVVEVVNFHARAVRHLEPTGLVVLATHRSSRGSWTLALAGGAEIVLGRDQADERLERFAASIDPLLRSRPDDLLRHADLRYPNGFALAWQPLPPAALPAPGEGEGEGTTLPDAVAVPAPASGPRPVAAPADAGRTQPASDRVGAAAPARAPINSARASAPRMNAQDPMA